MNKKIAFTIFMIILTLAFSACSTKNISTAQEKSVEDSVSENNKLDEEEDNKLKNESNNASGNGDQAGNDDVNNFIRSAYTDGKTILELKGNRAGKYSVCVYETFHDDFYDATENGNVITLERVISKEAMPEAEQPYDEKSIITLTFGESTEGAFTYKSIQYHRETELYFYNLPPNDDGTNQDPYFNESFDATLLRDDSVSNNQFHGGRK